MGRLLKSKKAKLEKLIKTTWHETDKGKMPKTRAHKTVLIAIELTKIELLIYDKIKGTAHLDIFNELYLKWHEKSPYRSGKLLFELSDDFAIKNVDEIADTNNSETQLKAKGKITKKYVAGQIFRGYNDMTRYTNLYIKIFEDNFNDVLKSSKGTLAEAIFALNGAKSLYL